VICRQGTAAAPITVKGVLGPAGESPVIEGISAVTAPGLNYWSESRGIVKIGGQGPRKPLEFCSIQIIFDGAPGNVATIGNLAGGEPFLQLESQNFINLAHR